MKHHRGILAWAYLSELAFVGLVYGCMVFIIGEEQLLEVIQKHWVVFSATAGGLFATGVGAIFYLSQVLESDFGKYLHWRKADLQYMRAYQMQAVLFLLAAGVPMVAMFGKFLLAGHVAWIINLYAGVNGFTIVQNTVGLVRLRQKFRSEHDFIAAEMGKERIER